MYPTASFPGKIYGTSKLHKLPINGTVHNLPIWPIVSNIGTASYHLAKYLAKVLLPCRIHNTLLGVPEILRIRWKMKGYHKDLAWCHLMSNLYSLLCLLKRP